MNSLFRATVSLSNIYWQIADAQDKRTTIYFSEQCVLKVDYFPRAASQRFINVIDAPMEIDATVLLNIDCIDVTGQEFENSMSRFLLKIIYSLKRK